MPADELRNLRRAWAHLQDALKYLDDADLSGDCMDLIDRVERNMNDIEEAAEKLDAQPADREDLFNAV